MQYSFVQDIGLISIFLLVGFIIRYQIKFLQKLFIPVSIIAGLLALTLANNGFGLVSFSDQFSSYAGIMIAFLFGALPFTFEIKKEKSRAFKKATLQMGAGATIILLLQWGSGLLLGLTLLSWSFPELNPNFGSILAAGFFGGHGTAAAISESFSLNLQWEEATSLAMTSATVGIFAATIGGVLFVQWGIRKKHTVFMTSFDAMPKSLKTGLIPVHEQHSMGKTGFSNIAIDPLLMNFLLVVLVSVTGIFLTDWSKPLLNGFSIPAFSFAFVVGLLLKQLLKKLRLIDYFDAKVMTRICGFFADLIVAFGIASIKIAVVVKYAVPLILLFAFGIILAILFFRAMGPKLFSQFWFEKSLFLWGMYLGVTAIGIALLRMIDPEGESETLPTYALGYIGVTPVEVACLVFFPILASQGYQWYFTLGCLLAAVLLYLITVRFNRKSGIIKHANQSNP